LYSELIDIDITDNYFLTKKLSVSDISGEYTLGVFGYYNTTYTLFVSTEEQKLLPWNYGNEVSCRTKGDGEYCYFKYTNKYIMDTSYFIIVDYLFGSGIIFAKYYTDTPYDIFNNLPDKNHYDVSSKDQESTDVLYMNCKY